MQGQQEYSIWTTSRISEGKTSDFRITVAPRRIKKTIDDAREKINIVNLCATEDVSNVYRSFVLGGGNYDNHPDAGSGQTCYYA